MLAWSIGEVLWDAFADQERFGGAPLNFCANLERLGDRAVMLSGVGRDERGRLALERMRALGVSTEFVWVDEELPTGVAVVTATANGESEFSIPRPAAFDQLSRSAELIASSDATGVNWVYIGTLAQTEPLTEAFTLALVNRLTQARVFYDLNLRAGHWTLPLVQRLSHLAAVVKMNEHEAELLFQMTRTSEGVFTLEGFCRTWACEYSIEVICVTLGAAGCMVYDRGTTLRVPGYPVTVRDTVGAGDAFAAAFVHGYASGWPMSKSARFANALGSLVASRAGATPMWSAEEVFSISEV
jgi:fructokinase